MDISGLLIPVNKIHRPCMESFANYPTSQVPVANNQLVENDEIGQLASFLCSLTRHQLRMG